MDANNIRSFIKKQDLTHYEVSQRSGLSVNGVAYFMNNESNPRRKTLKKLEQFVETFTREELDIKDSQIVSNLNPSYQNVSNEDIYKLIESLGTSLGGNAKLVSEVLSSTYRNTKQILKDTEEIKWNTINQANKNLKQEK
ncbi:helix-turn-helix domain-containing protein [Nonlabens sp.]|jgi:transcriptional regulator with XRE-family HTH domain|uniref:helix-turn-helix domain-containing protein n=1 Tax=Nonlabens sp. TaxID=1888209 RepID=UPI0039E37410